MADLEHSKRSLPRATYTPIKTPRPPVHEPGRALDKWAYLAALPPTAQEMAGGIPAAPTRGPPRRRPRQGALPGRPAPDGTGEGGRHPAAHPRRAAAARARPRAPGDHPG